MACSSKDLEKWSNLAKDEIGETNVNLAEEVTKVREILAKDHPDLHLPPDADHFVERCLRCRKFDVERAAAQVHSFFKILADLHRLHKELYFQPSVHLKCFYDTWGMRVLKHRDSEGRAVILCDYEKLPAKDYNLDKGVVAFMTLMDELCRRSVETQRIGISLVVNFRGYEFGHAKQYTLSRIRVITRLLQGAFPMRYKCFHVIRSIPLFTYTYALIKPFLGHKIKNRVYVHGNDLTEFHKQVSPEILPESFGGIIPDSECALDELIEDLYRKDEYYKELFQYGYMRNRIAE